MDMEKKLRPRIKDGQESKTHFLYTDKLGREWSVVNFEKMMENALFGEKYSDMFSYSWEGMYFGEPKIEDDQFRGMTAEEIIKQIEESAAPPVK